MKINEVEQLVGITKKNIRFYEEQGLLEPERNKQNGYREYSESDVELLSKIKLLRRLSVPIEEIRRLIEGKLSLAGCLERHEIVLNHESHRLELIKELSRELAQEQQSFSELQAGAYLEKIDRLENGGNCFMNVEKTDVSKKKKRGALISAAVIAVIVIAWVIFISHLVKTDPGLPFAAMLWFIIPPLVILAGVLIAVRERIKEINKGEEDEALKY